MGGGQDRLQREGRCLPSEELGLPTLGWGSRGHGAPAGITGLAGAPGDALSRHLGFWEEQCQARAWQEAGLNPGGLQCREGVPGKSGQPETPVGSCYTPPTRADWAMEGGRCVTKVGRALALNPPPLA